MMRLDKIYTKVGDKGTTYLATGQKVSKASLRIETYGTVDELNAHLGLLRDTIQRESSSHGHLLQLAGQLLLVQNELFDIGAELATPLQALKLDKQRVVTKEAVSRLEKEMDAYNELLAPLQNFVLPGGHPINSQAHIARCICRRAERLVVKLNEVESLRDEPRIYLNRLSDWLFIASRISSSALHCEEVLWNQRQASP